MFTGIITDIGTVRAIEGEIDRTLTIATQYDVSTINIGASIACSGVCLTVIETGKENEENWFKIEASSETLNRTLIEGWKPGTTINLERALKLGDELGGHMVTGHVDTIATIEKIEPNGDSHQLTMVIPTEHQQYIAEKGSITLDGVSLTVNDVTDQTFTLMLIPHTWEHTTFSTKKAGDKLHVEIDIIARYVEKMIAKKE